MTFFSLSQRSVLPRLRGQDRAELLRPPRAPAAAAGRDVRRDLWPVLQRAQWGLRLRGGGRGHPGEVEVDRLGVIRVGFDVKSRWCCCEEKADDEWRPRLASVFFLCPICETGVFSSSLFSPAVFLLTALLSCLWYEVQNNVIEPSEYLYACSVVMLIKRDRIIPPRRVSKVYSHNWWWYRTSPTFSLFFLSATEAKNWSILPPSLSGFDSESITNAD